MKNIILTEKQLEKLVDKMKTIKENEVQGYYMSRQHLFTISKLSEKMWEKMGENESETIDDWMESKIAQAEESITSVVKAFMYDEVVDEKDVDGMGKLDYSDIIIGK